MIQLIPLSVEELNLHTVAKILSTNDVNVDIKEPLNIEGFQYILFLHDKYDIKIYEIWTNANQ